MATTRLDGPEEDGEQFQGWSARESLTQLRLSALVVTLILCLYAFIRVLPGDPILYETVMRPFRPDGRADREKFFAQLRAKDPPLGSVLPLEERNSKLVGMSRKCSVTGAGADHRATLVVMIGSCSKCVMPVLRMAEDSMRRYPTLNVVAISPSSVAELKRFRELNGVRLPMVSDADGRLAATYNAVWRPRAYVLSASGRLMWCQREATPDWQLAVDTTVGGGAR